MSGGDTAELQFLQAFRRDPDHPVAFFGTFPVFKQKKQIKSAVNLFAEK
ncbi:MAG TPA: hypothetical protein VF451_06175 [Acidobacteriota bacterium]